MLAKMKSRNINGMSTITSLTEDQIIPGHVKYEKE